ncbi:MAG: TspO/MBR family protein [Pseudomonadota bacterium]
MFESSAWMLLPFFGLCALTATTGAVFRPGPWYEVIPKPRWTPPDWLFPPAWSLLYCALAVSAWLLWRDGGWSGAALPLALWLLQLVLNAAWSWLFFGLRRPDLALIDAVAMWLAALALIIVAFPINAWAAWLLVPYLAWVGFATALNRVIWQRMRAGMVAE